MRRLRCLLVSLCALAAHVLPAQPADAPLISLNELKPGQKGEVWTVFRGTEPEPFSVEVTGVVLNALGPGKSLILCQLTDPRVQNMGAVAGMSGSPLYIEGKLAGALSYQIQRFETVRYAGFTPVADLAEVRSRAEGQPMQVTPIPIDRSNSQVNNSPYRPLQPVFTLGGLSPLVAELFSPHLRALGMDTFALGGSTGGAAVTADNSSGAGSATAGAAAKPPFQLKPGGAISVALATGDITLAGTGTVSRVEGDRITAFGHPMLSLGDVDLPMCAADIVTILPSSQSSTKVANTGEIIGTITQDRLSAISGVLGAGPAMIPVEVTVKRGRAGPDRVLRFNVARQQSLTATLVATGVSQAILGSNDAGMANGFKLSSNVKFPGDQHLAFETLYSGPQGFTQGVNEFVQGLSANLQNPYEKTFPEHVSFTIEPLETNPSVTLEMFQLSRSTVRAGQIVQATVAWRDYQGESHRQVVDLAIDSSWVGKQLEVILAPGRALDELSGRPRMISASELRSFDAYIDAIRDNRPSDGMSLAIVERTSLFTDQTVATPEAPGSIERIARSSDEARFRKRDAMLPLWETHLLDGKLLNSVTRRPLTVVD